MRVEPVGAVNVLAAQQHRGTVLERQGKDARLHLVVVVGGLQRLADRRHFQVFGRAKAGLFFLLGQFGGRGNAVALRAGGAVDQGQVIGTIPFVVDDAVTARRAAGWERGVSGAGDGRGVGVVAVGEPRAVFFEPMKAAVGREQGIPARQVVGPQLVEDDQDREAHRLGRRIVVGDRTRSKRQRRQKHEENDWKEIGAVTTDHGGCLKCCGLSEPEA